MSVCLSFLPLREISVELVLPRLPHELRDVVVLLPQVLVERLDRVEVLPLDVVELEPRLLLLEPPEAERVLARRVHDVRANH